MVPFRQTDRRAEMSKTGLGGNLRLLCLQNATADTRFPRVEDGIVR